MTDRFKRSRSIPCLLSVLRVRAQPRCPRLRFKVIQPQGDAAADSFYSPGILSRGTLYISGQGSRKPDGTRPARVRRTSRAGPKQRPGCAEECRA